MEKREIKFRAWDKKTMLYRGLFDRNWYSHPTECKTVCGINPSDINTMYVMQYTGLKDKNGKDIYEGDKLKIQLPMGGFWGNVKTEKIGIVRYESDYGGFIVEWEYSKNQHHVLLNCDIAFEGEVIGNIYEAPSTQTK